MKTNEPLSPASPADLLRRTFNGTDWLDKVRSAEELRTAITAEQVSAVIGARRHGESWAGIGKVLGLTRQGAFNRFGGLIQRYERTGLIDPVAGDEDLEMDEDQARAVSSALLAMGRSKSAEPTEGPASDE